MNSYLLFTSIWFLAAAAPGADTMLLLTTTLASGWKSAIATSLGISAAKVVLLLVSFYGLASLIAAVPATFVILKVIGCAFLLWRAYRLATATPISAPKLERGRNFWTAFIVGVSNPQAMMFYVAVVPVVTATTNPIWLSAIIAVGFSLISAFYIGLATPIRTWIARGQNQLLANRIVAGVLVALTIVIALR